MADSNRWQVAFQCARAILSRAPYVHTTLPPFVDIWTGQRNEMRFGAFIAVRRLTASALVVEQERADGMKSKSKWFWRSAR